MANKYLISVIGAGVMGEAVLASLLGKKIATPKQLVATSPRKDRREALTERFGITVLEKNADAVKNSEVCILTVKPQTLNTVLSDLKKAISPKTLVISILAGTPLKVLDEKLGVTSVVRAMPNTPALVGEAMTVWTCTERTTAEARVRAKSILGSFGQEVFVAEEKYLDMATALSGTGPAYIFMMMEALIDAGVHLGFPRYLAEQLVMQTISGSVAYARTSGRHPAELRNGVTSPGGTSAAGIYELEKGGLRTVLTDAVWAAYRRSVELGK